MLKKRTSFESRILPDYSYSYEEKEEVEKGIKEYWEEMKKENRRKGA